MIKEEGKDGFTGNLRFREEQMQPSRGLGKKRKKNDMAEYGRVKYDTLSNGRAGCGKS